jgi:hypothetical protein
VIISEISNELKIKELLASGWGEEPEKKVAPK